MTLKKNESDRAFGPFSLSLEQIRPHLLVNISEPEMVKLIIEMSAKFTKKRDQISDYVLEHRHVSAYTAFYLTTNIPKLHFLLSKLPGDVLDDFKNRPFIDMGSGPGTFSLAWKMLMKTPGHVEMIGVDHSQIMLDQATKIMNGFFPKDKFQTVRKFEEQKSNSILFFGHSINEMGRQKAQDHIMTIDPEYVMWIEPGTSEIFPELIKLRDVMLDHYDVLYPCPGNAACPNEWCHQVLRITHDPSIERLSQLVSLDRKILPMTAHVYRRKSKTPVVISAATVIRYIQETKFSFEYEVCHLVEGQNKNSIIEIQKKQLTKDEIKHFKNSNVGDRLSFEVEKMVGEKLRVKLL
ncbi:MAG: small ribosomal subunit Rsm22 family protein [Bacteriovorax sp.]|nr:small ribosomal subunit Rsm22 family protein [Bacteriovorax sp.]